MPFRYGIGYRSKNYHRKRKRKSLMKHGCDEASAVPGEQSADCEHYESPTLGDTDNTSTQIGPRNQQQPNILEEFATFAVLNEAFTPTSTSEQPVLLEEFAEFAVSTQTTVDRSDKSKEQISQLIPLTVADDCLNHSIQLPPETLVSSHVDYPGCRPSHQQYSGVHVVDNDTNPTSISPISAIKDSVEKLSLPSGWIYKENSDCIELLFIQRSSENQSSITKNITLHQNQSWSAVIENKECKNCSLFANIPATISDVKMLNNLVDIVNCSTVCIGNPDVKFHGLAEVRQGVFGSSRKDKLIVGQQYRSVVHTKKGEEFSSTIRSTQCQMLLGNTKERCPPCSAFRNTLFATLHNDSVPSQSSSTKTDHNSKVPLSTLSQNDLILRTQNIIKAKRRVEVRVSRLEEKLKKTIIEEGVTLDPELSDSIKSIASDNEAEIKKKFGEDSFQRLFWDQQMKALNCSDKRGMRWHPMFIKWCLNIKLRSSAVYRNMKESGVLQLPNERTLSDYTHWTKSTNGFSADVMC